MCSIDFAAFVSCSQLVRDFVFRGRSRVIPGSSQDHPGIIQAHSESTSGSSWPPIGRQGQKENNIDGPHQMTSNKSTNSNLHMLHRHNWDET